MHNTGEEQVILVLQKPVIRWQFVAIALSQIQRKAVWPARGSGGASTSRFCEHDGIGFDAGEIVNQKVIMQDNTLVMSCTESLAVVEVVMVD